VKAGACTLHRGSRRIERLLIDAASWIVATRRKHGYLLVDFSTDIGLCRLIATAKAIKAISPHDRSRWEQGVSLMWFDVVKSQ